MSVAPTHRTFRTRGSRVYGTLFNGVFSNAAMSAPSSGTTSVMTVPIGVRSVTVVINITGMTIASGTPQLSVTYYAYDPVTSASLPLATAGPITGTGAYYIQVTDPPTNRLQLGWSITGGAGAFTASVSYYAWY